MCISFFKKSLDYIICHSLNNSPHKNIINDTNEKLDLLFKFLVYVCVCMISNLWAGTGCWISGLNQISIHWQVQLGWIWRKSVRHTAHITTRNFIKGEWLQSTLIFDVRQKLYADVIGCKRAKCFIHQQIILKIKNSFSWIVLLRDRRSKRLRIL